MKPFNLAILSLFLISQAAYSSPQPNKAGSLRWKKVAHLWPGGGAFALSFSPNGKYLAVGGYHLQWSSLQTFSVGSWTSRPRLKAVAAGARNSIAFGRDSRTVFMDCNGGVAALDTDRGKIVRLLWPPNDSEISKVDCSRASEAETAFLNPNYEAFAVTPDGKYLLVGGFSDGNLTDSETKAFDTKSGEEVTEIFFKGMPPPLGAFAFSPNGQLLIIARKDGPLEIWDFKDSAWSLSRSIFLRPPIAMNDQTHRISFSPDGKYFAFQRNLCSVTVYSVESWLPVAELPVGSNDGGGAFDPAGRYLATYGLGGDKIGFWAVGSWANLGELRIGYGSAAQGCGGSAEASRIHGREMLNYVDISPDGRYLVTAATEGREKGVQVWKRESP